MTTAETSPSPAAPAADSTDGSPPPRRWRRVLPALLGLLITITAFVALESMVRSLSLADVRQALDGVSGLDVALALLFTAISFAAVSVYDVVAVETVAPGRVSRPVAAGVTESEEERLRELYFNRPSSEREAFAHAYADPPASLARDLDELRRVHAL